MFYRISVGWALGKASWRAIWDNKSLMILPLISLLAQIAVIASYVGTGDVLGIVPALDELSNPSASQEEKILGYVMLFLIYMVFNTITIFFNVALISCAGRALSGRPANIFQGLLDSVSRLHLVLMWAAVSSLFSLLLEALQSHKRTRSLIVILLGSVWSVLTYLVLPVMVFERVHPFRALSRSKDLIFKNWGEGLGGGIGVGLIAFLITFPGCCLLVWGLMMQDPVLSLIGIVWIMLGMLWNATASSVLVTAVYAYASHRQLKTDYFPELGSIFYAGAGGKTLDPGRRTMDNKVKGSDGGTQLHDAARGGHTTVVEVMLKRGGNAFAKDVCGRTALDIALANGHTATAALLQEWMATHREEEVVFDA